MRGNDARNLGLAILFSVLFLAFLSVSGLTVNWNRGPSVQQGSALVGADPAPDRRVGGEDLAGAVRAMCAGSCAPARFVALEEANGVANPYGVKFLSDYATFSSFEVPAGWSGQAWDGVDTIQFTGPVSLPRVAEASFRYNRFG